MHVNADPVFPVHGFYEQFLTAVPGRKGLAASESLVGIATRLGGSVSFEGNFWMKSADSALDEVFLKFSGEQIWRVGRFRSGFGFSDWSEQHYNPFVTVPMVRGYGTNIGPDTSLDRKDRGLEITGGTPGLQYQVAVVDSSDDDWQVVPKEFNTLVGRLQAHLGPLILGASGFTKIVGKDVAESRVGGMDFRFTTRRLQFRGEYITGSSHTEGGRGFYTDIFYRPEHLARTQLGFRFQGFRSLETGSNGKAYSLGVRHFLNPMLTLSLNYGWGKDLPEAQPIRGISLGLLSSLRF